MDFVSTSSSPCTPSPSQLPNHEHQNMSRSGSQLSPDVGTRPRAFSGVGLPSSPRPSEPPLTPMSPPMLSASSFKTSADSDPPTPAYSPMIETLWPNDSSALSSPVSPHTGIRPSQEEPVWEMMVPTLRAPEKCCPHCSRRPSTGQGYNAGFMVPVQPFRPYQAGPPIKICTTSEEQVERREEDEAHESQSAPLGRLASRMMSLLRRRSDPLKKAEKRRKMSYEVDRMEDVHWTDL